MAATLSPYFKSNVVNTEDGMQSNLGLLAVQVLSQFLGALAFQDYFQVPTSNFWRIVLNALQGYVMKASTRSLEVTLSIRCLRRLPMLQVGFVDCIPSLEECLVQTRNFGKDHNRALQMKTEAWMACQGLVY